MRLIALCIVALHLFSPRIQDYQVGAPMCALVGLVTVLCLHEGDAATLGFRLTPVQGWGWWIRAGAWVGALILAVCLTFGAVWYLIEGLPARSPAYPPTIGNLFSMLVEAPVTEEIIYRWLLTIAVLSTLGERMTILLSGFVFGLVHIRYGNPGPDNLIAGFFLQWAYLRSGTILVPIAMHAAGNLVAVSFHVASWYQLVPGT